MAEVKPSQPYVSVAFVNRNDGYGGDLNARIDKFIAYYAMYAQRWPGLFEFVICDWNPPPDRPALKDAFAWSALGDVLHVTVPPEDHARYAGPKGRKMLDYIGRNVAIRRGRGPFSLVLNQDIFVSDSILCLIAQRNLDPSYFYRADRCDFDFGPCRSAEPADFENIVRQNVFKVHRRHGSHNGPISAEVTPETLVANGSHAFPGEYLDYTGIAYGVDSSQLLRIDRLTALCWPVLPRRLKDRLQKWRTAYDRIQYFERFQLHTNAGGDFILAPRNAFDKIHGMYETAEFYMHLDSYALAQLFAAGYGQAIFCQPHCVYHADHDRSGRADFVEPISWPEHVSRLSQILRGQIPFRLNGPDWALRDAHLPTERLSVRAAQAKAPADLGPLSAEASHD